MLEVKLTKSNFDQEVLKSDKPVLVDFWASWCGPCRMLAPELEKVAKKFEGRLVVGKANVDEEGELAALHRIESIPTLILYENGKPTKMTMGYMTADALERWLDLE